MSPRTFATPASDSVEAAVHRLWIGLGIGIGDARRARRWTVAELAGRAGVSRAVAYRIEAGASASPEAAVRLANALGLKLEFELIDSRRRAERRPMLAADPVHSAMGELEAAHLRRLGFQVGIDEPYQHYQFAGRADVAAWDTTSGAFLHLENRTRFPNLQAAAGAFNSKRAYLGASIAARVGISRWSSETHVIVALWSSEVLHVLRLRPESFRSICPDPVAAFAAWWNGRPPGAGVTSSLVMLDPLASGRQRLFVGLDDARSARPRHRGYAEVAARLIAATGSR